MMAITLDVTGFYFSEQVPFTGQKTVQQIMEQVAIKTAGLSTKFNFGPRVGAVGSNLNFISVNFDGDAPRSRQVDNNGIGAEKNERFFTYDDSKLPLMGSTTNGQAQFVLAWQYYVNDVLGALKSGAPKSGGFRKIIPFTQQSPDYEFANGDTVTWRLVGIFGTSVASGDGDDTVGKGYAVSSLGDGISAS